MATAPAFMRVSSINMFDAGELESMSKSELVELLQAKDFGLARDEAARVSVFERVSPAVAHIETSIVAKAPWGAQAEHSAGAGSGFVWDDEGHVITNYHVVAGAASAPGSPSRKGPLANMPRKVTVQLQGSPEKIEATVLGYEEDKDIAVLKIDPTAVKLTPLEIGSSADLRVGQNVLAIGNPFGLDFTLTTGIVSALGRDITGYGGRPIKDCVQTDAAINPGNSGGPLLDSSGRLIGVNTMIFSPAGIGGNVGIGFSIPVDTVKRVVTQILTFGQDARPSLGVAVVPDQMRAVYARNLRRTLEGALIADVVPGSPADALKLKACERQLGGVLLGDLITKVNGAPVCENEDLLCAVEEAAPGETITIEVMRGCQPGQTEELELTPVQRKALRDGQ